MAEAKIITGANAKGGAGKTVSVIMLSSELAHRGKKVLIVDTDSEKNISAWFDRCSENETPISNITLEYAGTANKLKQILSANLDDYDYIFIDTPGRMEKFQEDSFLVTDLTIIPVQACQSEIKGMVTTISNLLQIEEDQGVNIRKLVFNTRVTLQDRHIEEYKTIRGFLAKLKESDVVVDHCNVELMQRNPYRKVYSGYPSLYDLPEANNDSVQKAIEEAVIFTDNVVRYLETGSL